MAQLIARGNAITLTAFFRDSGGMLDDPTDPLISIVNALGATVLADQLPTRVSLGHYEFVYAVAADAAKGAWGAVWSGTVQGDGITVEDGFTVVDASTITFDVPAGETCAPWATSEDAFGPCANYTMDPDELDVWMQVASDVLFNLTGRRWPGACTDSIRPQAQWRAYDGPPRWWPATAAMSPYGYCSCHRGRETGCARIPEIRLPSAPVDAASVTVSIDGADFFDFRLDDHRFLVRTDGDGWPCCQDLLLDADQPNTWEITYQFGRLPPIGGRKAAAIYGCQLALANTSDPTKCALPQRAQQVVRAGTTVRIQDTSDLLEKGRTGLATVDAWVTSVLLGRSRRAATAIIPGRNRSARRVGQ